LPIEELHSAIRDSRKPVIAKVQGYAIGGGNVLATVCDLTIASEKAQFGQVGPRVGSVDPGWGTAYPARLELVPRNRGAKPDRDRHHETLFQRRQREYQGHRRARLRSAGALFRHRGIQGRHPGFYGEAQAELPAIGDAR